MATPSKRKNPIKNVIHFFMDRGLWHAVVGAFIGGVIAFSSGLVVYQIQAHKQANEEFERRKEDKIILLEGFEKNLISNMAMLKLLGNPKSTDLLVNNLNLFFLQSTSQVKYQTLDNVYLAAELDDVAFRLNSLEQDVRSYQSLYFNPLSNTQSSFFLTKGEKLRHAIVDAAGAEYKSTEPVLVDVLKELKKMGIEKPTQN